MIGTRGTCRLWILAVVALVCVFVHAPVMAQTEAAQTETVETEMAETNETVDDAAIAPKPESVAQPAMPESHGWLLAAEQAKGPVAILHIGPRTSKAHKNVTVRQAKDGLVLDVAQTLPHPPTHFAAWGDELFFVYAGAPPVAKSRPSASPQAKPETAPDSKPVEHQAVQGKPEPKHDFARVYRLRVMPGNLPGTWWYTPQDTPMVCDPIPLHGGTLIDCVATTEGLVAFIEAPVSDASSSDASSLTVLRLSALGWESIDRGLDERLDAVVERAELSSAGAAQQYPVQIDGQAGLVIYALGAAHATLITHDGDQWIDRVRQVGQAIDASDDDAMSFVGVAGHLLAVRPVSDDQVMVTLCRAESAVLLTKGPINAPYRAKQLAMHSDDELILLWSKLTEPETETTKESTQGRVEDELQAVTLHIGTGTVTYEVRAGLAPSNAINQVIGLAYLAVAATIGVLLMVTWNGPSVGMLPTGLVPGSPIRRMLAGAMDLIAALWVAGLFLGPEIAGANGQVDFAVLLSDWRVASITSSCCFCHAVIAEAFWGRTLGKGLAGLAVVRIVEPGTRETPAVFGPLGLKAAFIRNVMRWVLVPSGVLFVFTLDGRHPGDLLGKSFVVSRM